MGSSLAKNRSTRVSHRRAPAMLFQPLAAPSETMVSNFTRWMWKPTMSVSVLSWNGLSSRNSGRRLVSRTSTQSPALAQSTRGSGQISPDSTLARYSSRVPTCSISSFSTKKKRPWGSLPAKRFVGQSGLYRCNFKHPHMSVRIAGAGIGVQGSRREIRYEICRLRGVGSILFSPAAVRMPRGGCFGSLAELAVDEIGVSRGANRPWEAALAGPAAAPAALWACRQDSVLCRPPAPQNLMGGPSLSWKWGRR